MNRVVVTSFNAKGFLTYGERMISSFKEFWPEDVRLVVVSEDPLPIASSDRVIFHDYAEIAPEGVLFKTKFAGFPKANGRSIKLIQQGTGFNVEQHYEFRLDAIRFSHKVFSIFGVSRHYDCDELIWIDGDTLSHTKIDDAFYEFASPGEGHLSYLGRDDTYSECGFMVFNRRNRIHDTFMNQLATQYLNGDLFLLPQWHDCMIIDATREIFEKTEGIAYKNLSGAGTSESHPWNYCLLKDYMEHLKGPDSKNVAATDPVADRARFWSG